MISFTINGSSQDILSKLFSADKKGRLRLGWVGWSKLPITSEELLQAGETEFIGYVMEGFVKFSLHLQVYESGLLLFIKKTEIPRSQYLNPAISGYLNKAGFEFQVEEE